MDQVDGLLKSASSLNLGEKVYDEDAPRNQDGTSTLREHTKLEREVLARHDAAEALIKTLSKTSKDPTQSYMPSILSGALFCGHLVTDMVRSREDNKISLCQCRYFLASWRLPF